MLKVSKVLIVVMLLLVCFTTVTLADDIYRLGFGDALSATVWADGYGGLQQYPLVIQPNGKIVLAISIKQLDNYRLGPGDVIRVIIWGIDELSGDSSDESSKSSQSGLMIKSDGMIAFPLIGDVSADGLTTAELTKILTKKYGVYIKNPVVTVNVIASRSLSILTEIQAAGLTVDELTKEVQMTLSQYIKNPQVTLTFTQYRTLRIYVLGEADKPGMYEISSIKSHNLLDAIGAAGGYTRYVNKREVYIIRKDTGKCLRVDLNKLLKRGDLSQNYVLNEGDIVYLTKNGLSFINDIVPVITALYSIKVIVDDNN